MWAFGCLSRCACFPSRCLVLRAAGAGFGWLSSVLCGCCLLSVVRLRASCWVCCWWLRGAVLGIGLRLLWCFGAAVAGLRLLGWVLVAVLLWCCRCVCWLCCFSLLLVVRWSVLRCWLPSGWGVSSNVAVAVVSAVRASGVVCLLAAGASAVVRLSGVWWLRLCWLLVLAVLRWVLCFGWDLPAGRAVLRCCLPCWCSCCAVLVFGGRLAVGGASVLPLSGCFLLAVVSVSYDTEKRK